MDSRIFQTEIGHSAYSTSTKLIGRYDTVLYILLGVLTGLILIMKFGEIVYHRVVRKEMLENDVNSGKMENGDELIIVVYYSNPKWIVEWDLLHTFVLLYIIGPYQPSTAYHMLTHTHDMLYGKHSCNYTKWKWTCSEATIEVAKWYVAITTEMSYN